MPCRHISVHKSTSLRRGQVASREQRHWEGVTSGRPTTESVAPRSRRGRVRRTWNQASRLRGNAWVGSISPLPEAPE